MKERLVNVRLTEQKHQEFKLACELRGASMSSLLHQFIVRTIREEAEAAPAKFAELAKSLEQSKTEVRRALIEDFGEAAEDVSEKSPRRKAG